MLAKTHQPQRKSANLSIDGNLLADAKALEINVSRAAEEGIAKAVKAERERRWIVENRDAIDENNRYFEEHGLPFSEYRGFADEVIFASRVGIMEMNDADKDASTST